MSLIIDKPLEKVVRENPKVFVREDPLPFTITFEGVKLKPGWGGSYDYFQMSRCTERDLSLTMQYLGYLSSFGKEMSTDTLYEWIRRYHNAIMVLD